MNDAAQTDAVTRTDAARAGTARTDVPQKVAVLGTGKIGEALLSGMIRAGWAPDDLLVTARRADRAQELRGRYGVEAVTNAEAAKAADTLILAVKPQDMGVLLEELAPHVAADRLVISAAAGIPTAWFDERLTEGTPVVRVMPNTPVLVDEGMSVISAGRYAAEAHLVRTEAIFQPVGTTLRVPEKQQDAATALSGSWSRP
jgi:pyrroline-5-carboxylate reductase